MADNKPAGGKIPGGKPASSGKPISTFAELILLVLALILITTVFRIFSDIFSGVSLLSSIISLIAFVKIVTTIISMIALALAIYAFVRITELSAAETKKLGLALNWNTERQQKNVRWERVEQYMSSLNSSDWKIAILEADNILEDIIERMGYKGEGLGERLKQIEASDFPYLEEAWQAHKMRNAIAHKGTDYDLTRSDAEQTINIYHRVFKELGYL